MTAAAVLPVLPWWEAVCLAAIVAPTEAALIEALLKDSRIPEPGAACAVGGERFLRRLRVGGAPDRARVGLPEETGTDQKHWAWFIFSLKSISLLIGAAIGLAGGLVVNWSRRWWMTPGRNLPPLHWPSSASRSVNGSRPADSWPPSPEVWRS